MDPAVFYEIVGALLLAGIGAVAAGWLWRGRSPGERRLLPPQRHRLMTWNLLDVVLVLILSYVFCPSVAFELLAWVCGTHDLPEHVRYLAGMPLAACLQVPAALLALRLSRGIALYQVGLTRYRIRQDIVAGVLTWFVLTPLVYLVSYVTSLVFLWWYHAEPEDHPLTQIARHGGLSPRDWMLFVLATMVAAPVSEELVFRGIIQRWAQKSEWGGDVAMTLALALAYLVGRREHGLAPALFVLAMVPGYFALRPRLHSGRSAPGAARAIYSTALFFAAGHSAVWPTPVPLFVLGLGLGWLAYRTQSLAGPIVVHTLFNGVTAVALLLGYGFGLPAPGKGKPVTTPARLPAFSSISTCVPGSSLPRRRYASAITPRPGEMTQEVVRPTSWSAR